MYKLFIDSTTIIARTTSHFITAVCLPNPPPLRRRIRNLTCFCASVRLSHLEPSTPAKNKPAHRADEHSSGKQDPARKGGREVGREEGNGSTEIRRLLLLLILLVATEKLHQGSKSTTRSKSSIPGTRYLYTKIVLLIIIRSILVDYVVLLLEMVYTEVDISTFVPKSQPLTVHTAPVNSDPNTPREILHPTMLQQR